jgi:hypothetical protein
MHALYSTYYMQSNLTRFESDLDEKDQVLLIWNDGVLAGFTTLCQYQFHFEGRDLEIIFSGDTIMDRQFWGSQELAFAWLREIGRAARASCGRPLYWFLIVKGHRTYRYMPAFGINFVPRWTKDAQDVDLLRLRDALAQDRFGSWYQPATGIVRFPDQRDRLAWPWAAPTEREKNRADVSFFLNTNPGYVDGDELVCLCPLTPDNMRPLTRRVFDQGVRA